MFTPEQRKKMDTGKSIRMKKGWKERSMRDWRWTSAKDRRQFYSPRYTLRQWFWIWKTIADANRTLDKTIETIFLTGEPKYTSVASTIVRDIIRNGGDVPVLFAGSCLSVAEEINELWNLLSFLILMESIHCLIYLQGDVIIHAGDVSTLGRVNEITEFLNWFSSLKYQYKIFIAGNHDFFFWKK